MRIGRENFQFGNNFQLIDSMRICLKNQTKYFSVKGMLEKNISHPSHDKNIIRISSSNLSLQEKFRDNQNQVLVKKSQGLHSHPLPSYNVIMKQSHLTC